MIGQTFVVGLEDEPGGMLRVYVGHRYKGIYALVDAAHAEAQRALRNAWGRGGHVLIPCPPPECLYRDDEWTGS
jgi:hypothetical protein